MCVYLFVCLSPLAAQEEQYKEHRREKRRERKRKARAEPEEEEGEVDPGMAAMMGFTGFGGGAAKRTADNEHHNISS